MMKKVSYRPDIDVLRALSVLLVVFFHAQVPLFPGGYIGVDVFFVISGFLITSIITRQLHSQSFNIYKFFGSRIRRIFPAFFVMIVLVTFLCFFTSVYPYEEFKIVRRSMRTALLFYSNIYFYLKTNYFDIPAISQIFLHTWSLSVEAQFYFFYPFFLVAVYKKWKEKTSTVLLLTVIFLYFATGIFTLYQPKASFYFFPTRAWELLLGGWLALSNLTPARQTHKKICIIVGATLVCLSAMVFNNYFTPSFPGFWAIVPCLGAFLFISGGNGYNTEQSATFKVLNNRYCIFTGLISYSLYLWHWPIFTVYRQVSYTPNISLLPFFILLTLTFLAACASWKFVEQPVRVHVARWSRSRQVKLLVVVLFVALVPTFIIKKPLDVLKNNTYAQGSKDYFHPVGNALLGTKDTKPQFALWGDSHAMMFSSLFDSLGENAGITGRFIGHFGSYINGHRKSMSNPKTNESLKQLIVQEKYSTVFLASRWSVTIKGYTRFESLTPGLETLEYQYSDGQGLNLSGAEALYATLVDTITFLRQHGTENIFIILPVPECNANIPKATTFSSYFFSDNELNELLGVPLSDYNERNKEVFDVFQRISQVFTDVRFIDPKEFLYPGAQKSLVIKDGKALYYDDDHLSLTGAAMLSPLFESLPPFK